LDELDEQISLKRQEYNTLSEGTKVLEKQLKSDTDSMTNQ